MVQKGTQGSQSPVMAFWVKYDAGLQAEQYDIFVQEVQWFKVQG